MDSNLIIVCIIILCTSIFIYGIKNFEDLKKWIDRKKEKKIFKFIYVVFFILAFIVLSILIYKNIIKIINIYKSYNFSKENEAMYSYYDEKIKQENEFYKEVIKKEYNPNNCKNPYIPEDFEYVEGEWNTGFVIQDENKNQFVWIPCSNIENEEIVKLEKQNFENPAFISKDLCSDTEYEDFITSTLENGGFYISRFEIGKEENKPVSKLGVNLWKDVTRDEATEIINSMYESNKFSCKLINGLAYDTALNWLKKTTNLEFADIIFNEDLEPLSGRNKQNNIYDLLDNVFELTSEESYDTVIIRGTINDEEYKDRNRYSILKTENYFTNDINVLTFRAILYK